MKRTLQVLVPLPSRREWLQLINRADLTPRQVCCTPDEAREWAELVRGDSALYDAALRHLREVEALYAS